MAKTLKQILELYKPKAGDEQKFVAKHVIVKTDDIAGNKDDVYQATNVKTVDRKTTRKGYDTGDDEKVYEEVKQVTELVGDQEKLDHNKNGKVDAHDFHLMRKKAVKSYMASKK